MKKFAKGILITAGIFFGVGVVLGCIGAVGAHYTWQKNGNMSGDTIVRDALNRLDEWDLGWIRGDGRGLALTYDGIEFDENHGITYGSFTTDDGLRDMDVHNLDLRIGGGSLTLQYGDGMELKKSGGPGCQYYIEGDTFYLKQKCPVAGGAKLTLTLPEGIDLEKVDIEMGAGEVIVKDILAAEDIAVEVSAGEITMDAVKTGAFYAEVASGSVDVHDLDTKDCDIEVNMGDITMQDALVTGNMDAEVNMGDISIFLRDSYEDHDYEVECDMGDITICQEDGKTSEYAGLTNIMELSGKNSTGDSKYELTCNMGSILVKFSGKE